MHSATRNFWNKNTNHAGQNQTWVRTVKPYLLIAAGVAVVGALVFLGWPRQYTMKVTATEWTRQINIEELQTLRKYNRRWTESGARVFNMDWVRSCTNRYSTDSRGNRRVVGQDCTTYPEYDYEIEEFVAKRWVVANGMHGSTPVWPEFVLNTIPTGAHGTGVERKGVMRETYTVYVRDEEHGVRDTTMPQGRWQNFAPGQIVTGVFSFGGLYDVRLLEQ